jgi:hypothetical protein
MKIFGLIFLFLTANSIATCILPFTDSSFVVIVGTGEDSLRLLKSTSINSTIIRTDFYDGLKTGLYSAIESSYREISQAAKRTIELKKSGINAYAKNVGRYVPQRAVALSSGRDKLKTVYQLRFNQMHYETILETKKGGIPLFVFEVADSSGQQINTICKSRIMVVLIIDNKLNIVKKHGFLTQCDSLEGCQHENVRQYPLSKMNRLPTTIAQESTFGDELRFDFLVFDESNLTAPYCDSTIYTSDAGPGAKHLFAPNDFNRQVAPLGFSLSKYKGDGRTLVEGEEVEGVGTEINGNPDAYYKRRTYLLVWSNGQPKTILSKWEKLP